MMDSARVLRSFTWY